MQSELTADDVETGDEITIRYWIDGTQKEVDEIVRDTTPDGYITTKSRRYYLPATKNDSGVMKPRFGDNFGTGVIVDYTEEKNGMWGCPRGVEESGETSDSDTTETVEKALSEDNAPNMDTDTRKMVLERVRGVITTGIDYSDSGEVAESMTKSERENFIEQFSHLVERIDYAHGEITGNRLY